MNGWDWVDYRLSSTSTSARFAGKSSRSSNPMSLMEMMKATKTILRALEILIAQLGIAEMNRLSLKTEPKKSPFEVNQEWASKGEGNRYEP